MERVRREPGELKIWTWRLFIYLSTEVAEYCCLGLGESEGEKMKVEIKK